MARKLIVEVVLDSAAYSRQVKKATATTAAFSKNIETVGRSSAAATRGVSGMGRAFAFASAWFVGAEVAAASAKAAFGEMAEAQKVSAQTAAVLKSTGGVAGVTAKNVDALAKSLMSLSGVDDEAIKSAENLLLTFTNIRGQAFAPATKAALDMSVALQEDLQTAALQVGKALQDPVRGITALRRAGVNFTASQQTMIRTLVETGDTIGAQKLILRELTREFGGSAAAAGKTLPGQLHILHENILNLAGAIAEKLNPALDDLAKKANKSLQGPGGGQKSDWAKIGELTASLVHKTGDGLDTLHEKLGMLGAPVWDKAAPPRELFDSLVRLYDVLHPVHVELGHVSTDLERLTAGMGKAASKPTGKVDLLTAGGIVIPPGTTPYDITGPNAQQRNTWFDAMVGRREFRAGLLSGASAQLVAYKAIGAILTARIAATRDITRKLNLEDDALRNAATVAGIQAQIHADLIQNQKDAKQKLKEQIEAARQETLGWLDFAVERAGATKTIKDDLAAFRGKEKFLQGLIRKEGRTLELVSELWRVRQQIRDLNKKNVDKDPLAGLFQVSSKGLANILAAGTGLGAAGRRQLGFNIAGAEIQPVHVHLNMDGREVASVVTKQQARAGNRTAKQTSGRRG